MKRRTFALLILLYCCTNALYPQVFTHSDSAFAAAKANSKPVLLVFSGSDWCAGCMRFEKQVLRDSVFNAEREKYMILLRADFPQRTQLSARLIRQNDSLAAIYNRAGLFPHIVLINPNDTQQQQTISYTTQSAIEFITELKNLLPSIGYHD